jgi:hypothetical protein
MKRLVVMMDVDGCLADYARGFTTLANEMFGTPIVETAKYTAWSQLLESSGGIAGLTGDQIRQVRAESRKLPYFWYLLTSLLTTEEKNLLRHVNLIHDVYFVTTRDGVGARRQTTCWLQDDLGLPVAHVIISKHKGTVALALGADYSIEDKASNASCIAWLTEDRTRSYLVDRLYNQVDPNFLASSVKRVGSVLEFLEIVEQEGEK